MHYFPAPSCDQVWRDMWRDMWPCHSLCHTMWHISHAINRTENKGNEIEKKIHIDLAVIASQWSELAVHDTGCGPTPVRSANSEPELSQLLFISVRQRELVKSSRWIGLSTYTSTTWSVHYFPTLSCDRVTWPVTVTWCDRLMWHGHALCHIVWQTFPRYK